MDNKRLLLIDGHSMAFRAFYALPAENFVNGAGQHTNAVHGFLSMFLGLLEAEQPSHVAVAFDPAAPSAPANIPNTRAPATKPLKLSSAK